MKRGALLEALDAALLELDEIASDEEIEEIAAELEDAIFLLECAEDDEEADGALEEIGGLGAQLWKRAGGSAALCRIAENLIRLAGSREL